MLIKAETRSHVAEKSVAQSMREGAQRSWLRNKEKKRINNKRNWKTKVIICAKSFMQTATTALCRQELKEGKQSGSGHIAQAWASSRNRAAV